MSYQSIYRTQLLKEYGIIKEAKGKGDFLRRLGKAFRRGAKGAGKGAGKESLKGAGKKLAEDAAKGSSRRLVLKPQAQPKINAGKVRQGLARLERSARGGKAVPHQDLDVRALIRGGSVKGFPRLDTAAKAGDIPVSRLDVAAPAGRGATRSAPRLNVSSAKGNTPAREIDLRALRRGGSYGSADDLIARKALVRAEERAGRPTYTMALNTPTAPNTSGATYSFTRSKPVPKAKPSTPAYSFAGGSKPTAPNTSGATYSFTRSKPAAAAAEGKASKAAPKAETKEVKVPESATQPVNTKGKVEDNEKAKKGNSFLKQVGTASIGGGISSIPSFLMGRSIGKGEYDNLQKTFNQQKATWGNEKKALEDRIKKGSGSVWEDILKALQALWQRMTGSSEAQAPKIEPPKN